MEGLARAAAGSLYMEIGGDQYEVAPLGLEDYADMEQHLLSKRPDPLELVRKNLEGLTPEERERMLDRAYEDAKKDNKITYGEIEEWMKTTLEGMIWTAWLSFRKSNPDLTLKDATKIVESMGMNEITELQRKSEQASGTDEAGNSTGPPNSEEGRGARSEKAQAGVASSA